MQKCTLVGAGRGSVGGWQGTRGVSAVWRGARAQERRVTEGDFKLDVKAMQCSPDRSGRVA